MLIPDPALLSCLLRCSVAQKRPDAAAVWEWEYLTTVRRGGGEIEMHLRRRGARGVCQKRGATQCFAYRWRIEEVDGWMGEWMCGVEEGY